MNVLKLYITAFLVPAILAGPFVTAFASGRSVSADNMNESLRNLDDNLKNRVRYIRERTDKILSLKNGRNTSPLGTFEAIANEYVEFENDSAMLNYTRALDIATEPEDRYRLLSERAAVLPNAGFITRAIDDYESIPVDSLSHDDLITYYENGRRMYSLITSFYSYYPVVATKWSEKVLYCHERLLGLLSDQKDSPLYRMTYGEYLLRSGESVKAETLLREVFETEPTGSRLKTRAAHILSHIASQNKDVNTCTYYLVEAVNNDLIIGLRELPSLHALGMLCYTENDIDRAYNYLNVALANSVECKSVVRMAETSRTMPIIVEAHQKAIDSWAMWLYITIGVLVIALVVMGFMLWYRHKRICRMRQMQHRLTEANRVKEIYIAQFLSMCSIYMDKLTQFGKTVNRKLIAGKTDEVIRMTKSGKYIEQQNIEFYDTFDNAFLHIYPTFVDDVNRLLRKDAQIVLKDGEKMNTDLRILAFMRLGIDDSSKIAQILNYSLNTIYTYRNKLKTYAIDRDNFENNIMKISSI